MKTRVYMIFLCADCTEQKRTVVARYSVHDLVLQRREKSVIIYNDTRVKRSEVRLKLACMRIYDLGTRQKHE